MTLNHHAPNNSPMYSKGCSRPQATKKEQRGRGRRRETDRDTERPCKLTGGDVQADDILVGDLIQVLAQPADSVAVGHDKDPLPPLDGRGDLLFPLHQEAVLRQLRRYAEQYAQNQGAQA